MAHHMEWWRSTFDPAIGEFLFELPKHPTKQEVEQIICMSKVQPGAKILDLGCGIGRHVLEFARRGYRVWGVDYSPSYVAQARAQIRKKRLQTRAKVIRSDMRMISKLFKAETFDLVASLFNSFGYFENRSEDQRVLRQICKVLKPNGVLVLNLLNGQAVRRRLHDIPLKLGDGQLSRGIEPVPNFFFIERSSFDPRHSQSHSDWTLIDLRRKTAKVARKSFRLNVYKSADLRRTLRAVGLQVEAVWGELSGGRLLPNRSWSQTILARKRR